MYCIQDKPSPRPWLKSGNITEVCSHYRNSITLCHLIAARRNIVRFAQFDKRRVSMYVLLVSQKNNLCCNSNLVCIQYEVAY